MKIVLMNLCILCSITVISSCTHTGKQQQSAAPDFDFSVDQNLRSNMHRFAYEMQMLDWAMRGNKNDPAKKQRDVVRILENMEHIAANVDPKAVSDSHPFLQFYLTDFFIHVDHARMAVASNPPSYYLAGQLSGGCTNCHRVSGVTED